MTIVKFGQNFRNKVLIQLLVVGWKHIGLDGEVRSVGAGALGGARPVHALRDVVGVLPRGTVCADAGGPVSRGPAVLVEQAGREAGLPGLGGRELGLLGHGRGGQ